VRVDFVSVWAEATASDSTAAAHVLPAIHLCKGPLHETIPSRGVCNADARLERFSD